MVKGLPDAFGRNSKNGVMALVYNQTFVKGPAESGLFSLTYIVS